MVENFESKASCNILSSTVEFSWVWETIFWKWNCNVCISWGSVGLLMKRFWSLNIFEGNFLSNVDMWFLKPVTQSEEVSLWLQIVNANDQDLLCRIDFVISVGYDMIWWSQWLLLCVWMLRRFPDPTNTSHSDTQHHENITNINNQIVFVFVFNWHLPSKLNLY